jgi:hypothetical protein
MLNMALSIMFFLMVYLVVQSLFVVDRRCRGTWACFSNMLFACTKFARAYRSINDTSHPAKVVSL